MGTSIGGGLNNESKGRVSFIGGGEQNVMEGQFSVIGGGSTNKMGENGVKTCIGGGKKNRWNSEFNYVAGGRKNVAEVNGDWAIVLGGENNFVQGNYASSMGRNAQALQNNCFAIGLEPDQNRWARAQQRGDVVIRAQFIELQIGEDDKLVIDKNNILKFKRLLDQNGGTARLRRDLAKSEEELQLLDVLEDYEDSVEQNSNEIEELQHNIAFHVAAASNDEE